MKMNLSNIGRLKIYVCYAQKKKTDLIPEEEVLQNIRGMGYATITPRSVSPSYYKLNDGTIIRALVHLNAAVPEPSNLQGFSLNTTNLVNAFVPKEKRRPEAFEPYGQITEQDVVDPDVEFEVLRENFSVYDLSNRITISLKTVVGQIKKTKHHTKEGEPIYTVNTNPIYKVKPAE